MTRQEFINNIIDWDDLFDVCNELDCQICSDIYDEYDIDNIIDDWLRYSDSSWRIVRDKLSNIPEDYAYYLDNGDGDIIGLDDSDFRYYKDDVLDWSDARGLWDEENDDNNDDEYEEFVIEIQEENETEESLEPEDFSLSELFTVCNGQLIKGDI